MWYGDTPVDAQLDAVVGRRPASKADALASIAEATAIINRQIDVEYTRAGGPGVEGFAAGDIGDRLRKWIEKLTELVEGIARQFSAVSYSITVGVPGAFRSP
jgi:hypothetical protein